MKILIYLLRPVEVKYTGNQVHLLIAEAKLDLTSVLLVNTYSSM